MLVLFLIAVVISITTLVIVLVNPPQTTLSPSPSTGGDLVVEGNLTVQGNVTSNSVIASTANITSATVQDSSVGNLEVEKCQRIFRSSYWRSHH